MTMRLTVTRADFLQGRRQEAWLAGRALADLLLGEYCQRYDLSSAPPPAKVVDELLTDFLGCRLDYRPLSLSVFAQTEWTKEEIIVTVNSKTAAIPGVRDVKGVENVAKWHECVHVTTDSPN